MPVRPSTTWRARRCGHDLADAVDAELDAQVATTKHHCGRSANRDQWACIALVGVPATDAQYCPAEHCGLMGRQHLGLGAELDHGARDSESAAQCEWPAAPAGSAVHPGALGEAETAPMPRMLFALDGGCITSG